MKVNFDNVWSMLGMACATFAYCSVTWFSLFDNDVTNEDLAKSICLATATLILFIANKK